MSLSYLVAFNYIIRAAPTRYSSARRTMDGVDDDSCQNGHTSFLGYRQLLRFLHDELVVEAHIIRQQERSAIGEFHALAALPVLQHNCYRGASI